MRFELPEDYKFVYKVETRDCKADFDINTIVGDILSARVKKVDQEIIRQLRKIGEEKGINELILIDESKVLKFIKSIEALEIIKKRKIDVGWFKRAKDLQEYNEEMGINSCQSLSQEEYDLLEEVLL